MYLDSSDLRGRMERITVSIAREVLEELLQGLTSAYWDSCNIHQKDTIFDTLSIIYAELNEISKLSVNDYSMGYEPITSQFPACERAFKTLQHNIDDWFPRTTTADALQLALSKGLRLISTKSN